MFFMFSLEINPPNYLNHHYVAMDLLSLVSNAIVASRILVKIHVVIQTLACCIQMRPVQLVSVVI